MVLPGIASFGARPFFPQAPLNHGSRAQSTLSSFVSIGSIKNRTKVISFYRQLFPAKTDYILTDKVRNLLNSTLFSVITEPFKDKFSHLSAPTFIQMDIEDGSLGEPAGCPGSQDVPGLMTAGGRIIAACPDLIPSVFSRCRSKLSFRPWQGAGERRLSIQVTPVLDERYQVGHLLLVDIFFQPHWHQGNTA